MNLNSLETLARCVWVLPLLIRSMCSVGLFRNTLPSIRLKCVVLWLKVLVVRREPLLLDNMAPIVLRTCLVSSDRCRVTVIRVVGVLCRRRTLMIPLHLIRNRGMALVKAVVIRRSDKMARLSERTVLAPPSKRL